MGTMYDHADRIHAATVAIHEAVEDQLSSSSEVSAIVALDTIDAAATDLAAELAEAKARAERLRAMADAYAEVARHAMFSDVPRDVWAAAGRASADCLKHHDLDAAPGDTNN